MSEDTIAAMPPIVTLHAECLFSKCGFEDGYILGNMTTCISSARETLRWLVQNGLLPAIPLPLDVEEMDTIHNPIRVASKDPHLEARVTAMNIAVTVSERVVVAVSNALKAGEALSPSAQLYWAVDGATFSRDGKAQQLGSEEASPTADICQFATQTMPARDFVAHGPATATTSFPPCQAPPASTNPEQESQQSMIASTTRCASTKPTPFGNGVFVGFLAGLSVAAFVIYPLACIFGRLLGIWWSI